MLNLDTEDWGEIFIGCAGGGDSMITLPVEHEPVQDNTQPFDLTVSGVGLPVFVASLLANI